MFGRDVQRAQAILEVFDKIFLMTATLDQLQELGKRFIFDVADIAVIKIFLGGLE